MEEIKNNEAQAPQVESELDVILNENKALKAANEKLAFTFVRRWQGCRPLHQPHAHLQQ